MGKKQLSIVVPMYNEQETIELLYKELNRVAADMPDYTFEYLFVNDGSKDHTLDIIRRLAEKDDRVHYLSFSRNFGRRQPSMQDCPMRPGIMWRQWMQIFRIPRPFCQRWLPC